MKRNGKKYIKSLRKQTQSTKKRERLKRLEVQKRENAIISPSVIIGMLIAGLLFMFTLMQYVDMVELNDEAAELKSQMDVLKIEEAKLLARYELAYDLQAIKKEVLESGEMVKMQNSQIYVIELAEPDAVNYYEKQGFFRELLSQIKEIFPH